MKPIKRSPKNLEITIDKIENYQNLYSVSNKVISRWNYAENSLLKDELLKMSNFECAYCGEKINLSKLDVEHFLPKSKFPYLSYSYLNLLPSCKTCNQTLKRSIYPKSLEDIRETLGEAYLEGEIEGIQIIPFDKATLFNATNDRIIDPSFDNPEDHIIFNPETCEYTVINSSNIGKETKNMFFRENQEYICELQVLSSLVMKMISEGSSKDTILNNLTQSKGFTYHINIFYEFWREFFGL